MASGSMMQRSRNGRFPGIQARRAAGAPRDSVEERYRLAARATDDIIWDYDVKAASVRWSEALTRRLGHAPEGLVTSIAWWEEHIHPADLQRVTNSIGAVIESTGDYWAEEYRLRRADGGYADVLDRGYVIRDADGRGVRMTGALLDLSDRKAAELRLRESEARFRQLSDHAPVMVWVTEADHRTSYLSQSWYDFTGQAAAAALGDGWTDAIHPDDARELFRTFRNHAAAHTPFEVELRLRRRDGEWRWIIDTARPRFDAQGGFLGYVGSLLDITERKATEEALRASEERLRLAQEAAGLGIFDWDMRADQFEVSESYRRLYGLGHDDEVTSERILKHTHPDDRRRVRERMRQAEAGAVDAHFEFRIIRASDGAVRWLALTARTQHDASDRPARRLGVIEDITERKEAEARLRESEENFRFTVELSPQLAWTADADGSNIEFKRRFYDMPDDGGSDWVELATHPDDSALRRRAWEFARRSGTPLDVEFRVRHPNGEYRWIRSRGYPRRDAEGRIVKWYGVAEDIHPQRIAELQLQRLQEELSQVARVSAMGTLASTLAHELNQPLTAVANYMAGSKRLIDRHGAGAIDLIGEALEAASKAAVQAGEIVRRLRDLVARGEVNAQRVELARLVHEACDLTFGDARDRTIELSLEFGPYTRAVLADRIQLQQVLVNLLRNAAEAMVDSPRRTVNLSAVAAGDDSVMVRVEDSGPGVSPEVKRHLFSPFVTTKATGMGVGLSICRSIIEAHSGQLWVEDAPTGGAAFCFTLRRAPADA